MPTPKRNNRLHRCPKCRALIYTKRCVLCDNYLPTVSENSPSKYGAAMKSRTAATQLELSGIRVIRRQDFHVGAI